MSANSYIHTDFLSFKIAIWLLNAQDIDMSEPRNWDAEIEELKKKLTEAEAGKMAQFKAENKEIIKNMRETIQQRGITAQDLGFAPKKAAKEGKSITYRDSTTGDEWDGEVNQKGRKPEWIKQKIANGTIEQYRVEQ